MARHSAPPPPPACGSALRRTRRRSMRRASASAASASAGGHFPRGSELVDCGGQGLRELLGEVLRADAGLGGELSEDAAAGKHPADLIGRDRLIRAGRDPGARRRTQSLALELADDALHSAMLLYEGVHHGGHLGPDDSTNQPVEQSHEPLLSRAPRMRAHCARERLRCPRGGGLARRGAAVRRLSRYYIITKTLKK